MLSLHIIGCSWWFRACVIPFCVDRFVSIEVKVDAFTHTSSYKLAVYIYCMLHSTDLT